MLDIEIFRKNLEVIKESERKRFKDPSIAEKVLEYDKKWRSALAELQELRQKRNEISILIGKYKKEKKTKEANEAIKKSKQIKTQI
ncbi:MAG: serine--tRNA ligase, partial [Promethearchaeota archaeon]